MGCLLGQKTFLNEFVAFQNVDYIQKGFSEEFEPMTERSLKIATYALCGFSNIGSVGMTISGQRPRPSTPALLRIALRVAVY